MQCPSRTRTQKQFVTPTETISIVFSAEAAGCSWIMDPSLKNKEMQEVCDTLGLKHIFSPVYTPQSNGRLEGWHRFFKACIAKHIRGGGVEWDEIGTTGSQRIQFLSVPE